MDFDLVNKAVSLVGNINTFVHSNAKRYYSQTRLILQYIILFQGYQQIGTAVRSCPTSYGNSNRWSGDPFQCIPIDQSQASRSEGKLCYGVTPSDSNVDVTCEPGHVYGELKELTSRYHTELKSLYS